MSRPRTVCLVVAGMVGLVLLPRFAFAYVDPGTGSFLLQAAIGAIAGLLIAARIYWSRLRERVSRLFSRRQPDDPSR